MDVKFVLNIPVIFENANFEGSRVYTQVPNLLLLASVKHEGISYGLLGHCMFQQNSYLIYNHCYVDRVVIRLLCRVYAHIDPQSSGLLSKRNYVCTLSQ